MSLDPDDPNWPTLLSHPAEDGKDEMPLERHLCGVAGRARAVTPPGATTAGGKSLRDAVENAALAHDIGKATEWFQQSLDDSRPDPSGEPSHHSPLGSLVAYYVLRDQGFGPTTRLAGLVAVAKHHGDLPDAAEFLEALDDDTRWEPGSAGYSYHAARQAMNIDGRVREFANAVFEELCDDGSWPDFRDRLRASVEGDLGDDAPTASLDEPDETLRDLLRDDFYRVYPKHTKPEESVHNDEAYVDELRLFGALTFADKTDAARIGDDDRLHADPLAVDAVENHIDSLPDADDHLESSLNDLRSAIQDRVRGEGDVDPVREFVDSDGSVATLTLPTGYGKTLTGLLAAARIRERTGGDRIVYALPFTSIVDQTADVLADVTDESGERRAFSVHHHLAETVTLPDDDEADSPNDEDETDGRAREDVMLAESWRAGVTLTTFVQLFESLAGPRNGQSMKLPALNDAVVVIDEPQALPLRWWPLVQRLLRTLVSEFDATVLLMTATQPRLVEDAHKLVPHDELTVLEAEQFEAVPERVEYRFDATALPVNGGNPDELLAHSEAASRLAETVLETQESNLAICNTIDSARELFEEVEETLEDAAAAKPIDAAEEYEDLLDGVGAPDVTDDAGDPSRPRSDFVQRLASDSGANRPIVLHLTTRIRPCDRRFLLAVADDLARMEVPFVLVSTQLIEAGVDVSFDRVFRDFGPLDSIVQAAGRCNRSFERAPDTGEVVVWQLEPPEDIDTPPSEAVYERTSEKGELDLLSATRTALGRHVEKERADERTVAHDAVTSYHEHIGGEVAVLAPDNDLLGAFERAAGRELRRASLIDRKLSYEVYVCRTKDELKTARSVKTDAAAGEWDSVEETREQLADIRVSVPVYRPGSDAAKELSKLNSFTGDKGDAERILDAADGDSRFDASLGVQPLEAGVEDRFF